MGKTEWEGRHVAVTGGAEGIGYAIARAFAGWGLKPVLIDIQAEKPEAAAAALQADGIGTTIFCPGLLNTAIWDGAKARPERFGGIRRAPHEAGAYWRAAQGPEITMPHLLEVVAAGGGTCAAFTDEANVALFDERTAAMRAAIRVHQP